MSVLIAVGAERAPISVPVEQSRGRQLATSRWIGPIRRRDARSPGREASWDRRKAQRSDAESSSPGRSFHCASPTRRGGCQVIWRPTGGRSRPSDGLGCARHTPPAAFCSGPPTALGLARHQDRLAREGRPATFGFMHLPLTRPSPLILRFEVIPPREGKRGGNIAPADPGRRRQAPVFPTASR
jgi:hypothetical protein